VAKTCSHHSFQSAAVVGGLGDQAGLPLLSRFLIVSTGRTPASFSAEKIVRALPCQVVPGSPDHQ
jgi:hypothetical protein